MDGNCDLEYFSSANLDVVVDRHLLYQSNAHINLSLGMFTHTQPSIINHQVNLYLFNIVHTSCKDNPIKLITTLNNGNSENWHNWTFFSANGLAPGLFVD